MTQGNGHFHNRLKWMLKEGKRTAGAWLQTGSNITAEIMAKAGFDWLMIDMEHGPGDLMALISQCQAVEKYGVAPFARAPWNDFVSIKQILNAGVTGILIPRVNNAKEAEQAMAACKYPLEGVRGIAPSPRANGYGMDGMERLERANRELVILVAIETPEAVACIDEITRVHGIDGIYVSLVGLATSMGYFGNYRAEEVDQAIRRVEEAVKGSGKFLATNALTLEQAEEAYGRGYSFVAMMSDSTSLGTLAAERAGAFREGFAKS